MLEEALYASFHTENMKLLDKKSDSTFSYALNIKERPAMGMFQNMEEGVKAYALPIFAFYCCCMFYRTDTAYTSLMAHFWRHVQAFGVCGVFG
jgi:hypothetical protein